jgi:Ca2+-binding EF-hand superfamily protein
LALAGPLKADGGVWSPYDTDGNGYLEPGEYASFRARQPERAELQANWRFESVDADGDGRVSELEMVLALQRQMETMRKQ